MNCKSTDESSNYRNDIRRIQRSCPPLKGAGLYRPYTPGWQEYCWPSWNSACHSQICLASIIWTSSLPRGCPPCRQPSFSFQPPFLTSIGCSYILSDPSCAGGVQGEGWTTLGLSSHWLACLFVCFKCQGWRDLSLPQMGGRPVSKSKSQDGIQTSAMSFFLPFLLGPPPHRSIEQIVVCVFLSLSAHPRTRQNLLVLQK